MFVCAYTYIFLSFRVFWLDVLPQIEVFTIVANLYFCIRFPFSFCSNNISRFLVLLRIFNLLLSFLKQKRPRKKFFCSKLSRTLAALLRKILKAYRSISLKLKEKNKINSQAIFERKRHYIYAVVISLSYLRIAFKKVYSIPPL